MFKAPHTEYSTATLCVALQGLEEFTQLEKLSLASLRLKSLKGLPPQLTSLAVNDNCLTGASLSDLVTLTRLRRLDLAGKRCMAFHASWLICMVGVLGSGCESGCGGYGQGLFGWCGCRGGNNLGNHSHNIVSVSDAATYDMRPPLRQQGAQAHCAQCDPKSPISYV